jgi:hypothetical protein
MNVNAAFVGVLLISWSGFAAPQDSGRAVLRVPAKGDQEYEVTSGPCIKRKCPIAVSLLAGRRTLDRRTLEMNSSSENFQKSTLDRWDGNGDPAHFQSAITAWRSGDDEDETVLAVSSFRLAPGLTGILIDQRAGFENVKRRHVLLASRNNKLVELWKRAEGTGPTYSTTVPLDASGGRQALLFYSVFLYPENDAPDRLLIESLAYDAATGRMMPYSIDLNVITLGPFRTVAAARTQRAGYKRCEPSLWVLPAKGFGGQVGYVLATVASTPASGQAAELELKKCAPAAKLSSFRMKPDKLNLW